MKIIHCSDIHLDSKMETNLSPAQATQRNHEICHTFERMIQFAEQNEVSVIMICGDLFDGNRITRSTLDFVMELIRNSPHIKFLYLCGNHDESISLNHLELPQNLKLFSDEWKYYKAGNVVFAGIELNDNNFDKFYDTLKLPENSVNIVMLHGQISASIGKEQISTTKLARKNIDYLALGHIHTYEENPLDHRGVYCYSGCLEGRGFDETGDKGFVLLETNEHSIQRQFVPFAGRIIYNCEVDISKCEKITDVLSEIRQQAKDIPDTSIVRICLTGTKKFEYQLDIGFLLDLLSPSYYYLQIKDETKLQNIMFESETDSSLRNAFISSVSDDMSLSEQEKSIILQLGLAALKGDEWDL